MAKAQSRTKVHRKTPVEIAIGEERFTFLAGQLVAYEHALHFGRAMEADRRGER